MTIQHLHPSTDMSQLYLEAAATPALRKLSRRARNRLSSDGGRQAEQANFYLEDGVATRKEFCPRDRSRRAGRNDMSVVRKDLARPETHTGEILTY